MNHACEQGRNRIGLRLLAVVAAFQLAVMSPVNAVEKVAPFVTAYFKQHCYRCHGKTLQKGERRLDQLPGDLAMNPDAAQLLEDVLGAINRGDMPPAGKGVARPSADQTRQVVKWITEFLEQETNARKPATTTMRRLNRFEYVNTLRDLLGLHTEAFDPTGDFPADANEEGLDNNGEALTLSDFQLQRYLEVAEASIEKAVFFNKERPRSRIWQYTGADFNGVKSYERAPVTWRLIVDDAYLEIGHGQPSERHPNFVQKFVAQGGAPADGWYTIRVRAAAANRRDHGYDHREFGRFEGMPLKLALWVAPQARLLSKNAAEERRLVKVWDLPDGTPEVFTQGVWLGKGAIPFLSWTNGVSSKGNIRRVAEKYHPEVIRATKTQLDAARLGNQEAQESVKRLQKNKGNKLLSEVYQGPRLRVWGMDIEGPTFEQWPPASHQLLFGAETSPVKVDIAQSVQGFAARAFRRPVQPAEVAHYVAFIEDRIKNGATRVAALKLGLAAILTSPRFLYLDEGNEELDPRLNAYEQASRLSYFLWSAPPDAELMKAAAGGQLNDQQTLSSQVNRMLRDSRAADFVEHFTDSWLRLRILGSMPPDSKAFESYYKDRLEMFFKKETHLFFADLLESNGSILNFLDSDYAFLNDALAKHYGIEGVQGEHFRKVILGPADHRGGLLGQGSVLTLTANGIETSPVVRGIWVLENILGTPPPPPPPDVQPLEPDTRGTTSIREQLDKHRTVAACADCHRKIDPAGFALEFYDPVGAYRSRYPARKGRGLSIDGAGQLPSGETFQDERGLKRLLLDRKQRFTEALAEKLLAYGTGRSMTFRDQAEIKKIARVCASEGYGLRDLVLGIVASETFRKR
jgi:hypothetical protein